MAFQTRWEARCDSSSCTVGESVAELGSARSENVKVETDWAALRCSLTAACFFRGKKKKNTQKHMHTQPTFPHSKNGSFVWIFYSLDIFSVIFFLTVFAAFILALFTLSYIVWNQEHRFQALGVNSWWHNLEGVKCSVKTSSRLMGLFSTRALCFR